MNIILDTLPSPLSKLKTWQSGIAEGKSIKQGFLQNLSLNASWIWYSQANELDTLAHGLDTRCRFSQYQSGSLHRVLRIGRGAITPLTTCFRFNQCKDLSQNGFTYITRLWDLTASHWMRKWSFHTRSRVERLRLDSKGSILELESQVVKVLDNKVSYNAPSKVRKARKSDFFVTLTQKEKQKELHLSTENVKPISVHIPTHLRPVTDDQFGHYLAGLIDGDGHFSSKQQLVLVFNTLDVFLAYKKTIRFWKG